MHANDADHSIQDGRLRRHFVFRRESYKTFNGRRTRQIDLRGGTLSHDRRTVERMRLSACGGRNP